MVTSGQQLTADEVKQLGLDTAKAVSVPALVQDNGKWRCQRCQSWVKAPPLPDGRRYCAACLVMGRLTSTDRLFRFPSKFISLGEDRLTWGGQLTVTQQATADALIASYQRKQDHLVWAVTGAGKTEMLFPLIATALHDRKRIAIVSPRVDVVLELAPRIRQAFAQTAIAVRYGGHADQTISNVVLATVHQLLRFYHAFDLIIVDEVDAFPMTEEQFLPIALKQASRGSLVYLTATPNRALLRRIPTSLAVSRLFRRFHGFPLPVPVIKLTHIARRPELTSKVWRVLSQILAAGRQCLIFVPQIAWIAPLVTLIAQRNIAVQGAYAADKARHAHVEAFRTHQLQVLVTTTILERGVTFYHCGVIVLGAEDATYSEAALIQIAGRAGRSAQSPDDPVYFFANFLTMRILRARQQIIQMNRYEP